MAPLTIREEMASRSRYVIEADGEIDATNAAAFGDACARAVNSGAKCVEVDLSHVTFIDSAGIAALVFVRKGLSNGRHLAVTCEEGPLATVLDRLNLASLLNVTPA